MLNMNQNINPAQVEESIQMLNKYIKEDSIKPLISLLETLKKDPDNKALLPQVSAELNNIGVLKGAVLTYAPYVWIMLSEDPFEGK